MANVRVVRTVRIAGRVTPVKKVPSLGPLILRSTVEATTTQLRVMAEESRELILDRIFAATPTPPGEIVLERPPVLRRPDIPTRARASLEYAPLTRKHVLKKKRTGADGRFMIELGDYIRGIEVYRGEQSASGVYFMVRPADREHRGADPTSGTIRLVMLARVLEFGSATHNIPPRPHWGPALADIIAMFQARRPSIRAEALRAALRRIA